MIDLFELFRLLQVMVVPLSIASTIALLFAIIDEWATRPDRKPEMRRLLRNSVRFAYLLLAVDIYLDGTLLMKAAVFGFFSGNGGSLGRATITLGGQILFFVVCIVTAAAIVKFAEDAKLYSTERRAEWERRRRAEIQAEKQRRLSR